MDSSYVQTTNGLYSFQSVVEVHENYMVDSDRYFRNFLYDYYFHHCLHLDA